MNEDPSPSLLPKWKANKSLRRFIPWCALGAACLFAYLTYQVISLPVILSAFFGALFGTFIIWYPVKKFFKSFDVFLSSDQDIHEKPNFEPALPGAIAAPIKKLFHAHSAQLNQLIELVYQLKSENDVYRDRSQLLINNIAAAVCLMKENGDIEFSSPYTEVLTGYPIDEISHGPLLLEIVVEEDKERYERALKVSFLGEDTLVRFRITHKSGFILWLESRLVPVCNFLGDVDSVLSVTIDVTDSLNYQRQIEEQNRDISDFAYMVSHDLKAPIYTIKGMTEALKSDLSPHLTNSSQELFRYLDDASKRLESLVASIIEYSSLSTKPVEYETVSLSAVAHQACDDFSELITKSGASITISETLPAVQGNSIRLYQVFSNLIGNALKYRAKDRACKIEITSKQISSHMYLISVRDNGQGIPESKLEEVFRPYRRLHGNEIEGTGIGLASVKKIVEQLGGSIEVESIDGIGSVFSMSLPMVTIGQRKAPRELEKSFQ